METPLLLGCSVGLVKLTARTCHSIQSAFDAGAQAHWYASTLGMPIQFGHNHRLHLSQPPFSF